MPDDTSFMYGVVAEEDDYYPHIEIIGLFNSEHDAKLYAESQPREVRPWSGHEQPSLDRMVRAYYYKVVRIPVCPVGTWKPPAK